MRVCADVRSLYIIIEINLRVWVGTKELFGTSCIHMTTVQVSVCMYMYVRVKSVYGIIKQEM